MAHPDPAPQPARGPAWGSVTLASSAPPWGSRYNVWDEVECNVFAISPTLQARQASTASAGVQLAPQLLEGGFNGRLYVGALSASPPALLASPSTASTGTAPRSTP